MYLGRCFQWSFYVSLTVASLCLAYANMNFLALMVIFEIIFLALILVAFTVEGRNHLSNEGANFLGIIIGLGFLFWIYWNIPTRNEDFVGGLPWPARLLPVLAPLLPVLLLVKLFRRKSLADFWSIQVIGLIMVTLSCVLVGEPMFFFLLVAYISCLVWCLTLYYFHKQRLLSEWNHNRLEAIPLFGGQYTARRPVAVPLSFLGLLLVGRWTVPAVLLGVLFFLLAPRVSDQQWMPERLSADKMLVIKTGLGADMNMKRQGQVVNDSSPAFEAVLTNQLGPMTSVPGNARWRVQVRDYYIEEKWESWYRSPEFAGHSMEYIYPELRPNPKGESQDPSSVPPLKAGEMYVAFNISVGSRSSVGLPLYAPITNPREIGIRPMLGKDPRADPPLFSTLEGSDTIRMSLGGATAADPMPMPRAAQTAATLRYGQIVELQRETDVRSAGPISDDYVNFLRDQPTPPGLREFTKSILDDHSMLSSKEMATDDEGRYLPVYHERIARVLANYLSQSGAYSYSLQLRRVNHGMDATLDFLVNVKRGHCERFAGSLALMLRSVGVPARVIRGYRGCKYLNNGKVEVPLEYAHAWVEVLLSSAGPELYQWLLVDPTPSTSAADQAFIPWFVENLKDPAFLWRALVLEYNPGVQRDVATRIWNSVTPGGKKNQTIINYGAVIILVLVLCAVALFFFIRVMRSRPGQEIRGPSRLDFHERFIQLLQRYRSLKPHAGQTALEFAQLAEQKLANDSHTVALQHVPFHVVDLVYRIRFGGLDPQTDARQQIDAELNELEKAFRLHPV